MPTTLAIDCVGTACSVALFEDGAVLDQKHVDMARGHAEHLVPLIASLPNKGRADQIAVNIGPGSFTGVRIGLSVARALGLAWYADVLGYGAIELTAALARAGGNRSPLCVVLHGGHGEFFVQLFDGYGEAEGGIASLPPAAVIEHGTDRLIVGNAVYAPSLTALGVKGELVIPRASDIAILSAAQLRSASPHYGRAPDAAIRAKA